MDEKLMSLSFSVEANKGVYALLLGSGISYSAGIPTGWGVLKELCRRIMQIGGSEEQDEINWYEKKFGKAPLYDEVIGMLAKTSSERNGLLKEFFEPTEEELEEGRKVPTKAHKAIAELVKQGYIKVIVTTNFDRLIEQALDELNVQYQTLYHDSDIEGMKPLAHADCTVLKIHGDYRDTRFKNITDELESYSEPLTNILKRVFDEYGLIISGWSAEWDTALRDTLKGVKGRRYSWYWHSFTSEISDAAKELVRFRDAQIIIDNAGADNFFNVLSENVDSISKIKKVNPDSLQVKINSLKKFLRKEYEIEISELISKETLNVMNYFEKINYNADITKEDVEQFVEEIKEKTRSLSSLISLLAYNVKTEKQVQLLFQTLERLTNFKNSSGKVVLLNLQQLPLQIILYSIGLGLVKSKNYEVLNKIFVYPKVREKHNKRMDFLTFISPYRGLQELFESIYTDKKYFLPMEEFMKNYLINNLVENQLFFDYEEFNISYDIFEFLRSIKYRYEDVGGYYFSGRFGFEYDRSHLESLLKEGSENEDWPILRLCGNNKEKFAEAIQSLVKDLEEDYRFSGRGLVESYIGTKN
ncbi:hypothetical protein E2R55_16315 [Vibrio vulnificus]|nr:hypothetical protein E2R55_16315 [Vibrio vulnificus]